MSLHQLIRDNTDDGQTIVIFLINTMKDDCPASKHATGSPPPIYSSHTDTTKTTTQPTSSQRETSTVSSQVLPLDTH